MLFVVCFSDLLFCAECVLLSCLFLVVELELELDGLLTMNFISISFICLFLPVSEGTSFVKAQIRVINATCRVADIA